MATEGLRQQPEESELPPNLRWRLRLLISVDLVGSTALKQRSTMADGDIEPWLPWFSGFYDGFPLLLDSQFSRLPQPVDGYGAVAPSRWKYNGDEVLLHTCLTDYRQALTHIVALAKAIEEWRARWASGLPEGHAATSRGKRPYPLDVKGCAWLAGFPVSNSAIGDKPDDPDDFIGPQVDLGFRIARFASRTQLVVDPSLAHMVAEAMAGTKGYEACPLQYLGRKRLRGILENLPFPLFALSVPHELAEAEAELEVRQPTNLTLPPHKVIRFCECFHAETVGVGRPFIWRDAGGKFGLDPAQHAQLWKRRGEMLDFVPTDGWNAAGATADPPAGTSPADVEPAVDFFQAQPPPEEA